MKLKSALLLGYALGLSGSALVAQTDTAAKTDDAYNGRAWQDWSGDIRTGYIAGYIEGAKMVIQVQKIDMADKANFALRLLTPAGMTIGEVILVLDRFYNDALNRPIPIQVALTIVAREERGESKDSLDDYIRRARSNAAGANK